MKRYRILVLTVIIFVLCQSVALAQALTVGNMMLNKGIVKVRRAQVDTLYKTAGKQIPVHNLDEIQTGKDSSVTIKLNFKSDELELYSQSFFKIDNVTAQSSQLSMSIGKARFTIKKGLKPIKPRKNRKKRFRVRTANAIVGVKGTEFVLAAGADVTSVLTIEGIVDVASVATPEIEVEVKENQASQIRQASTPTAPVTVPASLRENIINADTPNVFNNVQFGEAVSDTSVKPEAKKKSPASEKKEESTSGGQGKPPSSQIGTPGLTAPGLGSADGLDTADTGTDGIENDDTTNLENLDSAEIDDTIDLENLDSAEIDDIDVEEPEIDVADIFDADSIIEEVEESTDEIEESADDIEDEIEEIEEIEDEIEEIEDEIEEIQEIEIKILYN